MKDYTETNFQRSSFIIKYTIDKDTNEIVVYYADGDVNRLPYNSHNEIMILDRMKKQVTSYTGFKDSIKIDRMFWRLKELSCLIIAGALTVSFGHLILFTLDIGAVGVGMIPTLVTNFLGIMVMKKYYSISGEHIDDISSRIKDYDKSMFYLSNEKVFDNERILRSDVIDKTPSRVKFIVTKSPVKEDIPAININTIDSIPMKDLRKTWELSLQSRPDVKVIKPVSKK